MTTLKIQNFEELNVYVNEEELLASDLLNVNKY